MAFTASVDLTKTPPTLTVVCDFRTIEGQVKVLGQSVPFEALAPVEIVDPDATWTPVSDDGTTAVYKLA